ncbi:MAG: amidohydrolase family protein [bacterium]
MTIDAHQHFWTYNDTDYTWIGETMAPLRRDHTPEDLLPQLRQVGVDGTVAVQARRLVRETDYLLALSDTHEWIRGVVGWVDFASDELEVQLEYYGAHANMKGVRELIHDMPDTDYAMSDVHRKAVGLLGRYGLTYDLLLRPQHIAAATRLVDLYPEQPFVIDHIAKPNIAAGEMSPWREHIEEIARRPHVYCKLSGMVTEANWSTWTPETLHPYLEVCLEAFGPSRLMIGSDWPVCTMAGSYESVMTAVMRYVRTLSPDAQADILGNTCARFYSLA